MRTVVIGEGRRLTLAELHYLTKGLAKVQWNVPIEDDEEPAVIELNDESTCEKCVAVWSVRAFQLAQNEETTKSAIALIKYISQAQAESKGCSDFRIPNIPSGWDRAEQLAEAGLAIYRAKELLPQALAVAAMTIDSLGCANTCMEGFQEVHFDVKRPDRGMIATASILRALLHDSKYEAATATDRDALRTVPQYHGPTIASIESSFQRLQLEVNAPIDVEATAVNLAVDTVCACVRLQIEKSCLRQGIETVTAGDTLSTLVEQWDTVLKQEASASLARIKAILGETVSTTTKTREEASVAKTPQPAADEFEGKSEAQIAKILKKRAEKEAKAAAKRANKQSKTVFGSGVTDMYKRWGQAPVTEVFDSCLSGGVQRKPKIAKGTRDYLPEQMKIRQQAFSIIRRVFESHGAVEIDTPVFELKDTLTGKYGEDSKLIYDLADQGGELLALRYDLTVPFARFLALNSVGNIKRFHIGKVYRRDQPALKRGRYREFYQCDFDIAGNYGRMVPDAECLCVACDILDALPIGDFGIKLNHRRLLDAIFDICGVPMEKFRPICSSVDKLDKEPWEEVRREMVEDKGLDEAAADKIGTFVLFKGKPFELHKELIDNKQFGDHEAAGEAMEDLRILFEYLEAFDKLKFISFDLSLARGLDYYTGVIYEAVCMNGNTQVGSIGGGGRYDNLVSMFQEAGKQTPCVGVSVGIERVFTLMEARVREEKGSLKQPSCSVYIASTGGALMKEKMKVARLLWNANISAEFGQQESAKLKKEVVNALDREIPFMVVIGEAEWADGKCQLKDLGNNTADWIPLENLVVMLRQKGVIPVGCEFAAELLKNESSVE